MTPIQYAQTLAKGDTLAAKAEAVALIARGLSDDDGSRAGWPVEVAVPAAAKFLGLQATAELIEAATAAMPQLPAFLLNRRED